MASSKLNKVKSYYEQGLWSKAWVRDAVVKGWITEEEYKDITGEDYE